MLRRAIDAVILVAAIWLTIAPYVFGYYEIPAPSGIASFLGVIVFALATTQLALPDYWEEIAIASIGVFVTASPWLFGDVEYISHKATESMVVTGVVLVAFALLGILVATLQEKAQEKLQQG